jgi:integrase
MPGSVLKALTEGHYQRVVDDDFEWRAEIRQKSVADDEGFRHGCYIAHPTYEWYQFNCGDLDRDQKLALCFEQHLSGRIDRLRSALAVADCTDHTEKAHSELREHRIADNSQNVLRLARKLMETEFSALEAIRTKDQTRYDEIVGRAASDGLGNEPAGSPLSDIDEGPLLSSLVEGFLEEEQISGLVSATLNKVRSVIREFVEVVGDKGVRSYDRSDAASFKDVLLKSPSNRNSKAFVGVDLPAAVALAEDMRSMGQDVPALHVDTINDKILYLRKFFTWVDGRYGDMPNPFEGQRIRRRRQRGKRTDRRHPFTHDELQRLFDGPIYRGCSSLKRWAQPGNLVPRDSARFWVPLIALYSGMRLGEIIQLRMSDIKQDQDGVAYFDITTLQDDDDGEAAKSLKNTNSVREMPIHTKLFEFGLQELIDERRDEGAARLFMDYGQSTDGRWSQQFSKWFQRYRKQSGVERMVGGKNRVDFHSFRHNFEDVVRNLPDVKQEVRDALQGHGENGVSAQYGTGVYRKTLSEAMKQVAYDDLDLSHLVFRH